MGRTLALFQVTGTSLSCCDLSEVAEITPGSGFGWLLHTHCMDPVRVPGVELRVSWETAAKKASSARLLSLGLLPHRESVPAFTFFCC